MAYESEKRGKPLFFYDKINDMAQIILKNVQKKYKDICAIQDFNLEINASDFVVVVGPSGCGKTTLLKLIGGIETCDQGEIINHNENISMVFQDAKLFPHMSVYENIELGIQYKDKKESKKRVEKIAKMLGLESILEQKAKTLSGGQSQKVSLARALAKESSCILMDEPCCHLDEISRLKIQDECLKIHEQLKPTIIYVSHDQKEAMKMAEYLVVMNEGKIQQMGTPQEIYQHPANLFVARFFGIPTMNFIERENEIWGIRPEDVVYDETSDQQAKVIGCEYTGKEYILTLWYQNQEMKMFDCMDRRGEEICIRFKNIHYFKKEF